MNEHALKISFPLGRAVITRNALDQLHPADIFAAIRRHMVGDWGDLGSADAKANDEALRDGCRLLSAYRDRNGIKFWVITEADRSATTILLPEDY